MKLLTLLTLILVSLGVQARSLYCLDVYLKKPEIKFRGKYVQWTPEMVLYAIRLLNSKGLSVESEAVRRGGDEYDKILNPLFQRPNMHKKLIDAKPLPEWNWKLALENAGLSKKVKRIQWTEEMVVQGIKALVNAKLPVNSNALQLNDIKYEKVLTQVFGRKVTASKLRQAKPTPGWNWDTALLKAGQNPRDIRLSTQPFPWTEKTVSESIQALEQAGLPINYVAVLRGGKEYEDILESQLKAPVTGAMLARANPTPQWSWDQALEKAGFRVYDHKLYIKLSEVEVVRAILLLYDKLESKVNSNALQTADESYNSILREQLGRQVNASKVVQAMPNKEWNWNRALIAAGLDPNSIRLRGSTPFHMLPEHLQKEFASRYEALTGEVVYQRQSGVTGEAELHAVETRTSEDLYKAKEVETKLHEHISKLTERDQYVYTKILEYFEASPRFNIDALHEYFQQNNYGISKQELFNVLSILRENKELLELILP